MFSFGQLFRAYKAFAPRLTRAQFAAWYNSKRERDRRQEQQQARKVGAAFNSALAKAYEESSSLYRGASWSGATKTLDGLKDGKIQSGGWIMGEREAEDEPSNTVSFTLSPTVAGTFGANSGRL